MDEEQVAATRLRQELHALPHGDVAPAHHPVLQFEVVRGGLIGGEVHAALRIALVAGRLSRYSPAGRFSMRYFPSRSDSTLTTILLLALRAWTKAPRNAAPSGPATVPEMVAASATHGVMTTSPNIPRSSWAAARMACPRVSKLAARVAPRVRAATPYAGIRCGVWDGLRWGRR